MSITRTEALLLVLVVAFASLATVHVTISLGLSRRRPRWRALVALLVPPFAPWWGFRERMWLRSVVWVVAAVTYVITFGLARG